MSDENETSKTGEPVSDEWRNVRYCEVIPVTRKRGNLTSFVYNTMGLNECPSDLWDALTEDEVNEEYGSIAAKLNGPRFWVLDNLVATGSSATDERFTFGGIEMGLRATLETRVGEGTVGDEFYVPNEVERDTVYTYHANGTVYELTSPEPEPHVYIMQSYSQIVDKDLTIDDLADLGDKLALPAGWTYAPRTLTEDLVLDSGGLAYVINDDLYNSYQRRT